MNYSNTRVGPRWTVEVIMEYPLSYNKWEEEEDVSRTKLLDPTIVLASFCRFYALKKLSTKSVHGR